MKDYLLLLLLACSISINSQNLIENGDFEFYSQCPTIPDQLIFAVPWENIADLTPDYYNQCAGDGPAGVPANVFGYQVPNSGDGYAAIYAYQGFPDLIVREYISIELDEPLTQNTMYDFSYKASLSDLSNFAVVSLGAYFSETNTVQLNSYLMVADPQIEHAGEALGDTAIWMTVSGSFIAEGGEKFVTIGNFKDDEECGLTEIGGTSSFDLSYYYIDDVVLSITPSSTTELYTNKISVFPNPFANSINLKSDDKKENEIIIYDSNSKVIIQEPFTSSLQINTLEFPKGIYFYEIKNGLKLIKKGKLIKE